MEDARIVDDQARRFRERGWWRDRTYLDDFDDVVRARPDAPAIVAYRQGHDEPVRLTYGELSTMVDRFAGALRALGVRPGEVVSMQLPNWWQFAALALACGRLGAVVNPMVPIFRTRELRFMLERTGSRVCITPSTFRNFDHAAMVRDLTADLAALEHPFAIDGTFEAWFVDRRWEDEEGGRDRVAVAADDLAQIQFTSGTTGEPKGVCHTYNTLWAGSRTMGEPLGHDASDVVLMASPLAHQTGFLYGIVMPLATGMTVVYLDVWDPDRALELCDAEGVTWTMGSTTFVIDALAAQRRRDRPLRTLRRFTCAGAPIPPAVVADAASVLGVQLIAAWGMTENGAVTLTAPGDPPELVADSDGVPVPWMEVRVVDDDGRDLPVGQVGRLLVRGANQTIGYYKRPDLYQAALTGDWFDSGDLARMRPDGGIRIAGRVKELIIRGGENIPVAEVEAALFAHPAVQEVAVVGEPDERMGERACAVVVPVDAASPPALADLVAHLDARGMAKQFWPERVVVVGEFPKTASGKIQKFRVKELLTGDAAST